MPYPHLEYQALVARFAELTSELATVQAHWQRVRDELTHREAQMLRHLQEEDARKNGTFCHGCSSPKADCCCPPENLDDSPRPFVVQSEGMPAGHLLTAPDDGGASGFRDWQNHF